MSLEYRLDQLQKIVEDAMYFVQSEREIRIVLDEPEVRRETIKKFIGNKNGKPLFTLDTIEIEETEEFVENVHELRVMVTGEQRWVVVEKKSKRPKKKTTSEFIFIPRGFDVKEMIADEGQPLSSKLLEALRKNIYYSHALRKAINVVWGPLQGKQSCKLTTEKDFEELHSADGGNAAAMKIITDHRKNPPVEFMDRFVSANEADAKKILEQTNNRSLIPDCEDNSLRYLGSDGRWINWRESWDTQSKNRTRDLEGEKLVADLIAALRSHKSMFVDPHFPPDDFSLWSSGFRPSADDIKDIDPTRPDKNPFLSTVPVIAWRTPDEIATPGREIKVFSGTISPNDVAQGNLGNCYFLAAIASCADAKDDDLLNDLIIEDGADVGLFGVKFFVHGKWTTVVVDNKFPCKPAKLEEYQRNPGGYAGAWQPVFAKPTMQDKNEMELWPLILEKAWAKLHRSYEATASGLTGDTHQYLTGGFNTRVDLGAGAPPGGGGDEWEPDAEEAWRALADNFRGEDPAFCSTKIRFEGLGMTGAELMKEYGLVSGHAYSVLRVYEGLGVRLVAIRNPWGKTEWKGRYSDSDTEAWTEALKGGVGYSPNSGRKGEDGSFWMLWKDFVRFFVDVDLCDPRILSKTSSKGAEDRVVYLEGAWGQWVAGETAGGNPQASTFKYNPRYKLSVQGTSAFIGLYQADRRPIKLLAENSVGMRVDLYQEEDGVPVTGAPFLSLSFRTRQASFELKNLVPGKVYTLVAATTGPGFEGIFSLTAAGKDCKLEPLALVRPSPEDAAKMRKRDHRYCVCGCGSLLGLKPFYPTAMGPVLRDCYSSRESWDL